MRLKNRRIDPGICINEILGEMDFGPMLLFSWLPMAADREGLIEDRPKQLRAAFFPYKQNLDLEPMLDELEEAGFIQRYETDGMRCIKIINFMKHQPIHKDEKASILPRPTTAPPPTTESDPTHGIKCDLIINEVMTTMGLSCSYARAGKILSMAGGTDHYALPYALIAIRRAAKWIKGNQYYGAVRKELRQKAKWLDYHNADIKKEAEKFEQFLTDQYNGGKDEN